MPSGKVEAVGRAGIIRQCVHFPCRGVGEGDVLHTGEGNFAVQIEDTAGHAAAVVGLTAFDGDVVPAVFRHVEIPLNPLPRVAPGIAADVVQHRPAHVAGRGSGGRTVITRVQRRGGTQGAAFALQHEGKVSRNAVLLRLRGGISGVIRHFFGGGERKRGQEHRLAGRNQGDGAFPRLEIKAVRLGDVAHRIAAAGGLFAEHLHLRRTDVIALRVLPHFAAVVPQAGEGQRIRAIEGYFAVDAQFALQVHAACRLSAVGQADVVETGFRYGDGERCGRAALHQQTILLCSHTVRIHRHQRNGNVRRCVRSALMRAQIQRIGAAAPDVANLLREVITLVFCPVVLHAAGQNEPQHQRQNDRRQGNPLPVLAAKGTLHVSVPPSNWN